jgi:hypothetical protein
MTTYRICSWLLVVFYALILLPGCGPDTDLKIPDSVSPGASNTDRQIPGTQLFMTPPRQFVLDSVHSGLILDTESHMGVPSAAMAIKGDSGTRIDVGYYPGINFTSRFMALRDKTDSLVKKVFGGTHYIKSFHLASYKAFIYDYADTVAGKEKIFMAFGDKFFMGSALACFSATNTQRRQEIVESLLTLYRDEDVKENDSLSKPFTLDLSATEFAYDKKLGAAYIYTVGGVAFDVHNTDDLISVTPLVPHLKPTLFGYIKAIVYNYQHNSQKAVRAFPGAIKGMQTSRDSAYESIGDITIDGAKGKLYIKVAGTTKDPVSLIAVMFHDVDKRLTEVQQAASTFDMK